MNDNLSTGLTFAEIPEAHIDRALAHAQMVFHVKLEESHRKRQHELLRGCERIGAYDGDTLVGLLATLPFSLSIPGGELPCAGVSFVSVAPTHRRRGVLSGLIDELYRRCAADGRPLAALWASEAVIYGRFGFGPGTYATTVEIDSTRPLRLRTEADQRPLRMLSDEETVDVLAPFYERTRALRAGRPLRTESWWREQWLVAEDEEDDELSAPRAVVLGDPVAGYVLYRTKGGDEEAGRAGLVRVDELEADSPAVAARLWEYVASIDLTGEVRAWGVAPDDPLLYLAADRDQVRVTSSFPALWVRLIDVRAALEARSWASDVDLVLDVRDAAVPANGGRFRLTVASGRAVCRSSLDAPDLTFEARDLASVYLGGTPVPHLVRAGLVTEHTPGATTALSTALAVDRAPHTVEDF